MLTARLLKHPISVCLLLACSNILSQCTYCSLALLLGRAGLLGGGDDGVEGEAEAGHAGQVPHVDVEH